MKIKKSLWNVTLSTLLVIIMLCVGCSGSSGGGTTALETALSAAISSPADGETIPAGISLDFQGTVSGGTAPLSYAWSFPGCTPGSSSEQNPGLVRFNTEGTYTCTFSVTDVHGDTESASVDIVVAAPVWETLSAGEYHSMALKTDGTLWAWGSNKYFQLGVDTGGDDYSDVLVQVGSDTDVWEAVSAGGYHTLALKSDGSLWAWGYNNHGQLGDGTIETRNVPTRVVSATDDWVAVSAEEYHTLALKSDGTLWAWGDNEYGELGVDTGDDDYSDEPVQVGSADDWQAVSAGEYFSLGIKTDGTLWAWGANNVGQLGVDTGVDDHSDVPVQVGSDTDVWEAVSAGDRHSMALKADGSLWAWGSNINGQLGVETPEEKHVPTRVVSDADDWEAVSAGGQHTLAFKTDGSLWAWGWNVFGQLGVDIAAYNHSNVPIQVGSE